MLNEQERCEREAIISRMEVLEIVVRSQAHLYHIQHHMDPSTGPSSLYSWQKCQHSPCTEALAAVRTPPLDIKREGAQ